MLSVTTIQELENVYDNPISTQEEFIEDLNRILYVTRALRRYGKTDKVATRLLVNQIVAIHNVFGQMGLIALEEEIGDDARIYLDTVMCWLGRDSNRVIYTDLYQLLEEEIK